MLSIMNANLAPPAHYKKFNVRLASLRDLCLADEYKRNLAAIGIYHDGNYGYKCAFCSLYLKRLDAHKLKYHTFSVCPMATQRLFENVTLRKQSFQRFKTARVRYKNDYDRLAQNGFYYYGKKAKIRCAGCLFNIVKLSKYDSAEDIHRTYSPTCPFNAPSAPPPSPPTPQLISNIYPRLPTKIDDYNETAGVVSENDDVDDSNSNDEGDAVSENEDDSVMCKICFDRHRDTCFMPCRHMSACNVCAAKCRVCCICRVKIEKRIKVFLQ
ncbi:IAP-2 [Alphabaculovirus myunipunctae]|uniref:IAP-2 n=1 Tax=Mythimna unipuncta nucleopolyhedrovirus TaxID=447897 RepID=A0A2K9VSC8_9ABAC|nr:IAP-2 [Mythimna unipuncta nucleopolyhedrovirus]AUV65363.1 IAP-2 [Mythimna unipuncta nucleopolyhedrovirus]